MHTVRTAAWLIAGIYATVPAFWMAIHPFAKTWRRKAYGIKWAAPWWVLLWFVAWAAEYPFRNRILYDNVWPWVISTVLWSISIYVYSSAMETLSLGRIIGRDEVDEKRSQALVTTGIYGRIRNPLYSAHLCTVLGWAIGTGLIVAFACAAFYLVTLLWMLPREEQELRERFGDSYREYEKRVPRLIPKFL